MATESEAADQKDVLLRAAIDRSLRHPVMFFFTSGAAWLGVSILFGFISSLKMHAPEFLAGFSWLDVGRTYPVHLNTLVYGWACQAAIGLALWLVARLSRREARHAGTILMAGHLWNLGVTAGVIGILIGEGEGRPWMEFPAAVWPVLLLGYFFIAVWSFVQFRCGTRARAYISQWYLLAALIWFPWVYATGHFFVFVFDGHPLMAAGINAWYKSAVVFLFLAPVGLGTVYYLTPKVTGRPVHSYSLAVLGFWSLAVIAPWAGMQKLVGAPVPEFLAYTGAAAAVLILIPALAAGVNILCTIRGHGQTVHASPALRFAVAGTVGFVALGFFSMVLNTPVMLKYTQFSLTGYGFEVLALYGFFSMAAFGGIYFIVPRITRREWLSRRFIVWHFWLSVYGVIAIVGASIPGGILQGLAQEAYDKPWMDVAIRGKSYAIGTTVAWGFILVSNLFFFLHLVLMWARLGRRSRHPTLLDGAHRAGTPARLDHLRP